MKAKGVAKVGDHAYVRVDDVSALTENVPKPGVHFTVISLRCGKHIEVGMSAFDVACLLGWDEDVDA